MKDPALNAIAASGRTSRKSYRNISRNFHNRLDRNNKVLPVKISWVPVRVRQHRPKVKELDVLYPMIALSDWASYLLQNAPSFLLGGYSITEVQEYTSMFANFWKTYKKIDNSHPMYEHHPRCEWGRCIPYCLHGDEGRGKSKVPILIQSYQMLIGPAGIEHTNMSG